MNVVWAIMEDYDSQANLLKVMGHPTRLAILDMLRNGETCVCHIEHALGKRQAYISQQLIVLREAGLVDFRKHGLQVYYRLTNNVVANLLELVVGSIQTDGWGVLEDCNCPNCSTIGVIDIQ